MTRGRKIGIIAFTLVELLVVVAIMTILLSLLLPSLSKARDRVKSIVCVSNLRQDMAAAASYATDNNGHVFLFGGSYASGQNYRNWAYPLSAGNEYMKTGSLLLCGADAPFKWANDWNKIYGVDYYTNNSNCPIIRVQTGAFNEWFRQLGRIVKPSAYYLMTDTWSNGGYQFREAAPYPHTVGFGVAARHSGKGNCGFFDGHSGSLLPSEFRSLGCQSIYIGGNGSYAIKQF